jgi:hypothetical protein
VRGWGGPEVTEPATPSSPRPATKQMMRWASPRRVGAVEVFARHARGLSALRQGE